MSNASNVVNLNTGTDGDQFGISIEVPELIKSVKRIAEKRITKLMQFMFEHMDDTLFEYADKAGDNQAQTLYFDAMRIIRLKKDAMSRKYHQELNYRFYATIRECSSTKNSIVKSAIESLDFEGLSLQEEDDLEQSLAVANMITKILNQYKQPLYTMAMRMDYVMNEMGFTSEHNPLSPKVVCEAFRAAVDTLDLHIKIKLIVYKLFDKFIVHNMDSLYEEVNKMFIAAGILPTVKFKSPIIARQKRTTPNYIENEVLPDMHNEIANSPAGPAVQPQTVSLSSDPFGAIQQLLAYQRQGVSGIDGVPLSNGGYGYTLGSRNDGGGGNNGYGGYDGGGGNYGQADVGVSANNLPCYITDEVVSGLSGLQQNANMAFYVDAEQPSGQLIRSHLVKEIARLHGDSNPRPIERSEEDTINIVSMMFDYILSDKTIPECIKGLIIKLQIPLVKVAIIDKTFFSKKNHAARQLLNELSYVADTLDENIEPSDDPIVQQVEYTINRVLKEFDNNVDLFDDLLREFKDFIADEIESNRLAEEILQQAKESVAAEIALRVENNRLPEGIKHFLLGPWKDVLKLIAVRDESEGSAWDKVLATMDDLVWSVQPKLIVSERQKLIKLIPVLLNALQDGLVLISFGQDNIDDLFAALEKYHLASLRYEQTLSMPNERIARNSKPVNSNSHVEDDEQLHYQQTNCLDDKQNAASEGSIESDLDEIIAHGMRHTDFEQDLVDPVLKRSEYFQFVHNMETGTWLEFTINGQAKRGKLSWKCDFTGEYTFIDRKFKVIADLTMREVINCMQSGTAKYVDDTPLFDRAINSIVSGLRKYVDSSPSDIVMVD